MARRPVRSDRRGAGFMTVMRRTALLAVLAVVASAALAAPHAGAAVTVGIADQKTSMFGDTRFAELGIRNARLQIGWDVMSHPDQLAQLDLWLAAANAAGVQPLISYGHSRSERRLLPSPSRLKYEFRRFRERYPWVTTFAAWNEANHCGEPTCHRPRLVGAYWKSMTRECASCTILGAELLDMPNMVSWVREFRRYVGREPAVWGLHNYVDANRFRTSGTRRLLRAVRGDVWLTEVGGLVYRRNRPKTGDSQVRLRESPSHAARATAWLVERLLPISRRLERVYFYHWDASTLRDSWDSALITPGGRSRPAMKVLQEHVADGEIPSPSRR
jgi:hypothetical protein